MAAEQKPTAKPELTLIDRFGMPLFWIGVGYALGFFHGNTSGKKKALPKE